MVHTPPRQLQEGARLRPRERECSLHTLLTSLAWLCHLEEGLGLPEDAPIPKDSGTLALVPPPSLARPAFSCPAPTLSPNPTPPPWECSRLLLVTPLPVSSSRTVASLKTSGQAVLALVLNWGVGGQTLRLSQHGFSSLGGGGRQGIRGSGVGGEERQGGGRQLCVSVH